MQLLGEGFDGLILWVSSVPGVGKGGFGWVV